MKILNSVTLKNLKINKKRTFVTILGITLSVALICAITTFIASFQTAMIERTKTTSGNYHILASHITEEQSKYLNHYAQVKENSKSQVLGYAKLEGSKNKNKPYVYLEAFDETAMNNRGVVLVEGRMPQNENELLISEHIIRNGKVTWQIGDEVTLKIGTRTIGGESLNQHNPYYTQEDSPQRFKENEEINSDELEEEQETFVEQTQKTYQIVGIMERPDFEDYSAPGYTVITKLDKIDPNLQLDMALYLKNPSQTYEILESLKKNLTIEDYNLNINEELLQVLGVFKSDRTSEFIGMIAVIVIGIILFTSAFVIRNSFNISLTEKTRELGMLASIGATSKQIRKSILFEGFVLGSLSIPLGIMTGILAIGIVLTVVNQIIIGGGSPLIDHFNLQLVISWEAIGIATILSVFMIFLSSIKPAIRASKITPIDAIRESSDIKITNQKMKTARLTKKIFKIEGEIASKNFKRSKKKYRTTIFSIFLSIVLFISMNSIVENLFKVSSLEYGHYDYNLKVYVSQDQEDQQTNLNYLQQVVNTSGVQDYAIVKSSNIEIDTDQYLTQRAKKRYPDMNIILVRAIGKEAFEKYCKQLGLSYEQVKNKGILYDTRIDFEYEDGKDGTKRVSYELLKLNKGDVLPYVERKDKTGATREGKIEIALRTEQLPMGGLFSESTNATLIISDELMEQFEYRINEAMIQTDNVDKTEEEIIKIDPTNRENVYNLEKETEAENNMSLIISIFLYGFIIVISIIGITNVFNTITTNMALRNREFAILKSIGMTNREFKRMIHYESLLYGTKALVFGIPVGVFFSYIIYHVTSDVYSTKYQFPVIPVLISIVFVFAIIFITMGYAMKKTKNQNIIETIRKENI